METWLVPSCSALEFGREALAIATVMLSLCSVGQSILHIFLEDFSGKDGQGSKGFANS